MSRAFRYAHDKATDYSNPHHSSAHLPALCRQRGSTARVLTIASADLSMAFRRNVPISSTQKHHNNPNRDHLPQPIAGFPWRNLGASAGHDLGGLISASGWSCRILPRVRSLSIVANPMCPPTADWLDNVLLASPAEPLGAASFKPGHLSACPTFTHYQCLPPGCVHGGERWRGASQGSRVHEAEFTHERSHRA